MGGVGRVSEGPPLASLLEAAARGCGAPCAFACLCKRVWLRGAAWVRTAIGAGGMRLAPARGDEVRGLPESCAVISLSPLSLS